VFASDCVAERYVPPFVGLAPAELDAPVELLLHATPTSATTLVIATAESHLFFVTASPLLLRPGLVLHRYLDEKGYVRWLAVGLPPARSPTRPRVESISKTVTDEVERKGREDETQTG